jgi:hypothetical protein
MIMPNHTAALVIMVGGIKCWYPPYSREESEENIPSKANQQNEQ